MRSLNLVQHFNFTSGTLISILLFNGYRVFLGVKQPGLALDHPPPTSAEVKERLRLYICSPSGLS
jgi:hypothetical protein